ncbi:MAG: tRNA 2-thiouridine(34) synthase MnmA [Bacteroidia bacterium]|nr:tRNA 2-thiouridine(34) synthase MnmA [Bacteroidia bacterium]
MVLKEMGRQDLNFKPKVVVGLSGGVDSSVAAYLLQQQGYEVIGLFMRNWNDASVTLEDECPWIDDSRDALMVAEKLGIPFQVIDLSETYKERIVDYMFNEYEQGRTPNPDVLCNREIKFDVFLKAAMGLGADFVATGHYVRKDSFVNEEGEEVFRLLRGIDPNKDQSYFLCQLNQYQLSKALFPIGELLKPKVREIAHEIDLSTASKKDSQGLCFIGKVSLPEFLQQKLSVKNGRVLEIDASDPEVESYHNFIDQNATADAAVLRFNPRLSLSKAVGEHKGAHFYTRGQRKGLQIGGKPLPLFVLATDVDENIIYVGQGESHGAMHYRGLHVKAAEIQWIRPDLKTEFLQLYTSGSPIFNLKSQIRYRQAAFDCALLSDSQDGIIVVFKELQKNVTPGQFVAVYSEDELIFSGVISL